MPSVISLLIVLISIAFFSGAYFVSSSFYYKKHDIKYSFKRMFPYEFNYPNSFKNNITGNIAFIISVLGIAGFYFYATSFSPNFDITLVVIAILSIMLGAFICCLLFMPLQFLRTHMILSTLAMVFAFALPALESVYIFPYFRNFEGLEKNVYLAAFIVGVLISLIMLIFIFNPKATYKIYLDKSVDENGNEVFSRPKFIPMAFNEWWAIITYFISPLPFIIISFIK